MSSLQILICKIVKALTKALLCSAINFMKHLCSTYKKDLLYKQPKFFVLQLCILHPLFFFTLLVNFFVTFGVFALVLKLPLPLWAAQYHQQL